MRLAAAPAGTRRGAATNFRSAEPASRLADDPGRLRRDPSIAPDHRPSHRRCDHGGDRRGRPLCLVRRHPAQWPALTLAGRRDRAPVAGRGVGRLVARGVDRKRPAAGVPAPIRRAAEGPIFRNAHLQTTSYTDSDGDTRYKLLVRDDEKKRTITSSMFDDAEVATARAGWKRRPGSSWSSERRAGRHFSRADLSARHHPNPLAPTPPRPAPFPQPGPPNSLPPSPLACFLSPLPPA